MDDVNSPVNTMVRKKLERFQEVHDSSYVVEEGFDDIKKCVQSFLCSKDVELVLELGCGKGEYVIALAQKFPDKKFSTKMDQTRFIKDHFDEMKQIKMNYNETSFILLLAKMIIWEFVYCLFISCRRFGCFVYEFR